MITPPIPSAATALACPTCASQLTADERFVQWCQACGWNVNPAAVKVKGPGDRFRRRLNRAAEERLYQRVTESGSERSGLDGATVGAYLLSGVVHLVTLALLVVGVAAVLSAYWPQRCVGVVLLLLAVHLRPRLGPGRKAMKRRLLLTRDAAPVLYGLLARVAAELGTEPPALLALDGRYNASYTRIGLRRRVMVTLGLPLWETLGPAQRLALLGHELGHGANGDSRRGLWVGSAHRALEEWYRLLRPGRTVSGGRSAGAAFAIVGEMFARVLMSVFAEVVLLAYRLLGRLTALSGRRAEYRADALAVRVAGADAAAGLMRELTLSGAAGRFIERRRLRGATGPEPAQVWTELRTYMDSIPETERARRLLVSQLDESAVDSTHPPTYLRLTFVQQLPGSAPAVVLSDAESAAIDAELAPARAALARSMF